MLIKRYYTHTQAQTKRRSKPGDELDQSIQNMTEKTQDLRKQVCFNVPVYFIVFLYFHLILSYDICYGIRYQMLFYVDLRSVQFWCIVLPNFIMSHSILLCCTLLIVLFNILLLLYRFILCILEFLILFVSVVA